MAHLKAAATPTSDFTHRRTSRFPSPHGRSLVLIFVLACALCKVCGAKPGPSPRVTVSLDGSWEIAEGSLDQIPKTFERTVPVPGLVSLAEPPFKEPGPAVADRNSVHQKDPRRDAFWYRRTFKWDRPVPPVATLKIGKAMFGTRVILNGIIVGDHLPSFTGGLFDVRSALKPGVNELIIRVGADRQALGPGIPDGFDFEKTRYIPGIFDSVELILSGTPHIVHLQVAPEPESKRIRGQAQLGNMGRKTSSALTFTVREAKSGRVVSRQTTGNIVINEGQEQTILIVMPMPGCRQWSPEDPFLYEIEAATSADEVKMRFGMRSFQFDPTTKRALLNGKPYFLRGSNITLYRFFEDSQCGSLPWDNNWVRLLHRRIKDMHWNSLRYCIGLAPEAWYRIADEEGVLIQDEFPIWYGGPGWSKWPGELRADELALEYTEWIRERCNHPSVVVWDASNETSSPETGVAVSRVRGLDLSHRPWDNSYGSPHVAGDVFESHPYHFQNPKYKLGDLAKEDSVPQGNALKNPGDSPVIINEYGWLWLNRDGTPTTLTETLYENLLGTNSTTAARRHLYARYLAAETEYWRSRTQAAAVMHFTALGYSRTGGQTSDHWLDVARLEWEPEFYRYVRDAFAPIGLSIDDWSAESEAGKIKDVPVIVLNDSSRDWSGKLQLQLLRDGRAIKTLKTMATVPAFGRRKVHIGMPMPATCGAYRLEAVLDARSSGQVHSLRDFVVVPLGLATSAPP